jgi:putative heme iron utilization protein
MAQTPDSPIRPTDDAARDLARGLIAGARHGALGVIDPESGFPMVTRVAVGTDDAGLPLTFISTLSAHTRALTRDPRASLLLGEPGPKGDPLTHPRLTLLARAERIDDDAQRAALAARWLVDHPKAKLYIGFADFAFWRFRVQAAHLNGGFGRAFVMSAADLTP